VARLCAGFVRALPEQLSTAGARREVQPDPGSTAAYGDPPTTVRCGVPRPRGLTPAATLVTVDGIDWLPEELSAGWMMTTVGRVAHVEITVPDAVGPAPSVAADLAATIATTLPTAPGA
jgi:hypothetical protein